MIRLLLSAAVLSALTACTSGVPNTRGTSSTAPVPEAAPVPGEQTDDPREQTLDFMLARTREDRLAGRLSEAELRLEAALRIAPSDARLWLELAEIQFAAGEFAAAQTLADRAISLAGRQPEIIDAARRLAANASQSSSTAE